MQITLFRWQATILNKLYKTDRYNKLSSLHLTKPQQIDYSIFFKQTPGINIDDYTHIIESTNNLCKNTTRVSDLQKDVIYLNQYMKLFGIVSNNCDTEIHRKQHQLINTINETNHPNNWIQFTLQHVVIYSSLSKCRIWPKILKSGSGLVPNLINFYNIFTKKYNNQLYFKFDPIILSNKYTKIMNNINLKKKDHPKLVEAVKNNNLEEIKNIVDDLEGNIRTIANTNQINTENKPLHQEQPQQSSTLAINDIVHKGLSISHIACQYSSLQTIKYLVSIGCNFQLLDDQKQTSIFYAVKRADLQLIKYLIEQIKININHREYQDRTLLYLAAFQGQLNIVDYLYRRGADPQLGSKLDRTPLSKACYLGNVHVVKYLLSINVNILKQDNKGRTALHNAVWGVEGGRDGKRRGHIILEDSPECAELLLQAGHPIDFQDYDGFTPFFSAVSSRAIRSMRLLIQHGANIYHKTKNQQNACFIAAKYGHLQSLKILIEQCKISYTDTDFHGYSSLCASITLQTPQTFIYLCNLYLKTNIKLQIDKLVECCLQYETPNNILYLQKWIQIEHQQDNNKWQNKIIYLTNHLQKFIQVINEIGNQSIKKKIDQNLGMKKQSNLTLGKQRYQLFQNIAQDKLQQESQDTQNNLKNNNIVNDHHLMKERKIKQEDKFRKILNGLLIISTNIVIHMHEIINHQSKSLFTKKQYQGNQYNNLVVTLLQKCITIFNKQSYPNFPHLSDTILKLTKIINPINPTLPPEKHFDSQKSIIPTNKFCMLELHHYQSQSQLIKLLTNKQVITNLVNSQQNIKNTLITLAQLRKTAVIISIFGKYQGIGRFSHDQLLDIIKEKNTKKEIINQQHIINSQQIQTNQLIASSKITLLQFCLLHSIFDIATYLQQICKQPSLHSQIQIPKYQLKIIELTPEQTTIQLQSVQQWVFEIEELQRRMSTNQINIYRKIIEMNEESSIPVFQSCNNYHIVNTVSKLRTLQNNIKSSLLIGIDVEHYNISKQENFICLIQISAGDTVYIIDTLSHLQQIVDKEEENLRPQIIGHFIRQLMGDPSKIKIFHAYENDVKWLHQDFNLHGQGKIMDKSYKNVNVLDTSKLYHWFHTTKKGQSTGLKVLCQLYLNYDMKKQFQRSDWRIRPLFTEMIRYASIDAEVLPYILLRMLKTEPNQNLVKQGFCKKRTMKSKGVRNQLNKCSKNLTNVNQSDKAGKQLLITMEQFQ